MEYNDDDIVVLDLDEIKTSIGSSPSIIHSIDTLDTLKPIQVIHVGFKKYPKDQKFYYITDTQMSTFSINISEIKRLANPKEIKEYYRNKQINKYNL